MEINQLIHTLSYGDAISGEALVLDRCFKEIGVKGDIYAINIHPKLKGKATLFSEIPRGMSGDLILHYSLGSPLNPFYASQTFCKRTLIYHNLTPPEWFDGVNPRIASDIRRGIDELPSLCNLSDRILADSAFNLEEIRRLGYDGEVLELPVDSSRWDIEKNAGIYSIVAGEPGIHLLHVGRLAPNKRIEDIIKIFYFLAHKIEPRSRLWLVGIDIDTELYSYSLKRLVRELMLEERVNFVGCLSDSEIRALYEACSVYLCMSEHEGYCLPLIEAMHFGLPVVGYGSSAVSETIGRGGIIVTQKNHAEIAELVYEISVNGDLRAQLISAGKDRIKSLDFETFRRKVLETFLNGSQIVSQALL